VSFGVFEDSAVTAETWSLLDRPETPSELMAKFAASGDATEVVKEREKHISLLQTEAEERSRQIADARQAFEEKVKHLAIVQGELDTRTGQLKQLQEAFDDKSRHVAILQREVEERTRQAEELARTTAQLADKAAQLDEARQQVARTKEQAEQQSETGRAIEERPAAFGRSVPPCFHPAHGLALGDINCACRRAPRWRARRESRRHHSWNGRTARTSPKSSATICARCCRRCKADLEEQQAAREAAEGKLKANNKQLRFYQKQMARLREMTARRLSSPFGKAHRRLQQLTVATRAG
jgi:uncharacterized phage infection (PIP) family protein YhgE